MSRISLPPIRFAMILACGIGTVVIGGVAASRGGDWWWVFAVFVLLTVVGINDLAQTAHAIRRNYPVLGNIRFLLEFIRPEIRQYFLESDNERVPYSRAQRSLVYQRAKSVEDKRPFGSELDLYEPGYEWINHSIRPVHLVDANFRVRVGGARCSQPYEHSILNISAMSFGALSANAIRALNKGAKLGGFAHDTGEGSISRYHREYSGDLVWEIGSGYFGCRTRDGHFDPEGFARQAASPQVKMIEIKLSQGAKPGHGGVLPGVKVSPEIAEARGVTIGEDCVSPAGHSAFSTPLELIGFIEQLRTLSGGKPVGFKFALGHPWEFLGICKAMLETGVTPDFIVVDGGEGGTGAAPVEFTDHVGVPLQEALLFVHNVLVGLGLRQQLRLGASGKIISAFDIARTLSLGADWCNVARGFMFALGCVQSQSCHTDRCPTGVATQNQLRQRALVVEDKAVRVKNFHANSLRAFADLLGAAGLSHPSELRPHHIVRRVSNNEVRLVSELFSFVTPGQLLSDPSANPIFARFWPRCSSSSFALVSTRGHL